ncbi:35444_t:CDS:2, partial [Gigaspora margarita]
YLEDIQDNDTQLNLQETEVRYAQGFGKIKKALNLALDLNCEDKFINMVNGFIACKQSGIEDTNNENRNLYISDLLVQKQCGHQSNKRIKLALEKGSHYSSSRNSAINPQDSNLYITNKEIKDDNSSEDSTYKDKNKYTHSMQISQQRYILRNSVQIPNSNNICDPEKSDAGNTLNKENNNNSDRLFIVNEHVAKCRYICKSYSKSGHNIRKCKYK